MKKKKKKNDLYLFKQYGSRGFLLKIEKIRLQKKKKFLAFTGCV